MPQFQRLRITNCESRIETGQDAASSNPQSDCELRIESGAGHRFFKSAIRNPQSAIRPLAILALAAALALGGCQPFAWLLVQTIGPFVPEDESEAEFNLQGKSVLILVDAKDPALASDNPRLESAMAEAIGKELQTHKACGPVVPAHSVDAARRAEPQFGEWSVVQVGKYFNVDYVLHVEVSDFHLKDNPGSNVYHGHCEAAIRIVSPESDQQVWPVLSAARLVVGDTQPDVESQERLEQETILVDGYAAKVAKLFYTLKKDDLPMRPKVK